MKNDKITDITDKGDGAGVVVYKKQTQNQNASKYKALYAKQIREFFGSYCSQDLDELEVNKIYAKGGTNVPKPRGGYPSFSKFARRKNVTLKTLENWRDNHEEFREAYAECKQMQEEVLVERGLAESYNPSLVKFMLSNHHGYAEKVSSEVNSKQEISIEGLSDEDRELLTVVQRGIFKNDLHIDSADADTDEDSNEDFDGGEDIGGGDEL